MGPSLQEIADKLDVSTTLVSRVLNNKQNVRVASETRARILKAAEELNYRPSASARALATGRTMQIAVLTSEASRMRDGNNYADLRGLVDIASAMDYRVLLLPLRDGDEGARQLENLIRDRICDGMCLFADKLSEGQLQVLKRHPLPFVVVGDEPVATSGQDLNSAVRVDFDNYRLTFDAVAWLKAQGHTSIGYARAAGEANQPHCQALRAGYERGLVECGAGEPIYAMVPRSDDDIRDFAARRECTALIVRDFYNALAWSRTLLQSGWRLPEDITILAILKSTDVVSLFMGGWNEVLACQPHDSRHGALIAGQVLVDWIAGNYPDKRTFFVPPSQPGWCKDVYHDIEKKNRALFAKLSNGVSP